MSFSGLVSQEASLNRTAFSYRPRNILGASSAHIRDRPHAFVRIVLLRPPFGGSPRPRFGIFRPCKLLSSTQI